MSMTKVPVEFHSLDQNTGRITAMSRMIPWTIAMRTVLIKEIKEIEKSGHHKVLHAFQDHEDLMRKFRVSREDVQQ